MSALVLFDIDGTILQLKQPYSRDIFAGIMKEIFGINASADQMPSFAGNTDLRILRDIADEFNIPFGSIADNLPLIWKKLLDIFKNYCTPDHIDILPGVHNLIISFATDQNVQLGLLTGNFKDNAYQKLKTYHMDIFFPFGAFGDDREDRNELPEIAIERANAHGNAEYSFDNTIIIGDSPNDITCAKSNGLPVVSVATGTFSYEELKDLNPDLVYKDFANPQKVYEDVLKLIGNK